MPVRPILTLPKPILRKKAHQVTGFDGRLQTLIGDLVETMRAAPGVGLAASQVGALERVIVVEYGDENDEQAPKKLYVMVNPEIVKTSGETEVSVEGCLSVPGLVGEVERPLAVVVKGRNRHGQPMRVKVEGWLARIFQHEIDHLNGVLFPDRATRVWVPEKPVKDRV